jgi:hypothetical protein
VPSIAGFSHSFTTGGAPDGAIVTEGIGARGRGAGESMPVN